MDRPFWVPEDIDIERPSTARIYDYHLGGSHNFAADREVAEQIVKIMPELPVILRANRAFLQRAVEYLMDAGIRQFLDLGSGIPTAGNVHEIAQKVDPGSRVVYIDSDAVAVAHSRTLLSDNKNAAAVRADLRDVSGVLALPETLRLIDFSQPVAVLMVAVLHFVPDNDDPASIVARYLAAAASGSYLVISHAAAPEETGAPEGSTAATAAYSRSVTETTLRTRDEVGALLSGLDVVDPGVVYVAQWNPGTPDNDEPPQRLAQIVAVARKP